MKTYIFNIGFNRSGTSSLTTALNILNIPSLQYSYDGITPIESVIEKNIKENKRLLESLDTEYNGFTDFTGHKYYKILYDQYPNSKFILTTREFTDWLKSYIFLTKQMEPELFNTIDKERKQYMYAVQRYFDKGYQIRDFFKDKPSQFLEMRICNGEGWEKLCPFLGVDVPDVPFPWENKTNF
jgi:hypothetical protein